MKGALVSLTVLFLAQALEADSLWWSVKTDPDLVRVKSVHQKTVALESLRVLLKTLDELPSEDLSGVLGKPKVIEGDTIIFPKSFTVPAASRNVFGNSIYTPKFITSHLRAIGDDFLVVFVYWGNDKDLTKRTKSTQIGFKWDDPFGIPYMKLPSQQLAIWEHIRAAEMLRAVVTSEPYRTRLQPRQKPNPFP